MRNLGLSLFGLGALLLATGCMSAPDEESDEEGSAAAISDDAEKASRKVPTVTCGAEYNYDALRDARKPSQTFDVVLQPNTAFALNLPTNWETFTATVTPAEGGKERTLVSSKGSSNSGFIGNTSTTPQKYRVTVKRSTEANYFFRGECYPLVSAPMLSGLEDKAVCLAGKACLKSTPEGQPQQATCSDRIFTNLGEPKLGGSSIGKCF